MSKPSHTSFYSVKLKHSSVGTGEKKQHIFDWRGSHFICILNFKGNISAKEFKILVGLFIPGGFITH